MKKIFLFLMNLFVVMLLIFCGLPAKNQMSKHPADGIWLGGLPTGSIQIPSNHCNLSTGWEYYSHPVEFCCTFS